MQAAQNHANVISGEQCPDSSAVGLPEAEAALAQLERILASSIFDRADRLRDLLRYTVEETIAGRGHQLSAYSIGMAVLGKPEGYSAQTDSLVRVHAGRLRRQVERYYSDTGGGDRVLIHFIPGSYRPRIQWREAEVKRSDLRSDTSNMPVAAFTLALRHVEVLEAQAEPYLASQIKLALIRCLANTPGVELCVITGPVPEANVVDVAIERSGSNWVASVVITESGRQKVAAAETRSVSGSDLGSASGRDELAQWARDVALRVQQHLS